jgi:MFS family permease
MRKLFALSLSIDTMLGIFQACSAATLILGGLTIGQGSLIFAANSFAIAALEYPTGSFADKQGRKKSTLLGLFLAAFGFLLLMQKGNLLISIFGMILNGLGTCFISGAKDAWFVNYAKDNCPSINLESFSLNLQLCGRIGVITGGLLGAYLLKIDPSYVWLSCAVFSVVALVFAIILPSGSHDISRKHAATNEIPYSIVSIFKNSFFLSATVLSGLAFGLEQGVRNAIAHPYILDLSGSDTMFLAYAQIINAIARTAGILAYKFKFQKLGLGPQFVALALAIFMVVEIIAGFTGTFWVFSLSYAIAIFAMGWYFPIRFALINNKIDESSRATILSIDSLLTNLGASITGLILYYKATSANFHNFWFLGSIFLGISSLLAYLSTYSANPKPIFRRNLG